MFLPETPATFEQWRMLVEQHDVKGAQVHDANIAAVAITYSVSAIVTMNVEDFARLGAIPVMTPAMILATK